MQKVFLCPLKFCPIRKIIRVTISAFLRSAEMETLAQCVSKGDSFHLSVFPSGRPSVLHTMVIMSSLKALLECINLHFCFIVKLGKIYTMFPFSYCILGG